MTQSENKAKLDRLLTLLYDYGYLPIDCALWHSLNLWKDDLPPLDDGFHKKFRQVNVTDSGHGDMIIWHLLDASELFWDLLEQVEKESEER